MKDLKSAKESRKADLRTPSALSEEARINIAAEVNALLADTFAIYMKTKNFHWRISGLSWSFLVLAVNRLKRINSGAD